MRTRRFSPEPGQPIEEHHLEAAVQYAAYIVVRYGEVYAPIFERLERELADLRRKRRSIDRARQIVEAGTIDLPALDGGRKALPAK